MTNGPLQSGMTGDDEKNSPDSANPGSELNPVFGGDVQPQEINDKKIVGAPDPNEPVQAAATETADTHPVFGSNAQPQDVYHERIGRAPNPEKDDH